MSLNSIESLKKQLATMREERDSLNVRIIKIKVEIARKEQQQQSAPAQIATAVVPTVGRPTAVVPTTTVSAAPKCRCGEEFCLKFPNVTGVGIIVLNNYTVPGRSDIAARPCVLLGRERAGNYKGTYNWAAGGKDNDCVLKAMRRELAEEFKIEFASFTAFVKHFKTAGGTFKYVNHHNTPMIIARFPGFSRGTLNSKIQAANNNVSLPWCQREMDSVEWFKISTKTQLENKPVQISSYVSGVLDRYGDYLIKLCKQPTW